MDSDEASQTRRAGMLRQHGVEVVCADDLEHAQVLWHADSYNLVIIDAVNVYDSAMVFSKMIKEERPKQLVTFLVGGPGFLSDVPLQGEVPADIERGVKVIDRAQGVFAIASKKAAGETGIMSAASQMSARRAVLRIQSAEKTIENSRKETSFGEAVRRASGE